METTGAATVTCVYRTPPRLLSGFSPSPPPPPSHTTIAMHDVEYTSPPPRLPRNIYDCSLERTVLPKRPTNRIPHRFGVYCYPSKAVVNMSSYLVSAGACDSANAPGVRWPLISERYPRCRGAYTITPWSVAGRFLADMMITTGDFLAEVHPAENSLVCSYRWPARRG